MRRAKFRFGVGLAALGLLGAGSTVGLFVVLLLGLGGALNPGPDCSAAASGTLLAGPGGGTTVGATEYGGPGDPSSGSVGASGVDLDRSPAAFAELGGTSFATADDLGGLAYGTPLRITYRGHSTVAEKEDIGLGGGPIDGRPRVIDLWWELAGRLSIPYEDGRWSGLVRIEATPPTGAANLLGGTPGAEANGLSADAGEALGEGDGTAPDAAADPTGGDDVALGSEPDPTGGDCVTAAAGGVAVSLTDGPRAELIADGEAEAPAGAPEAVKAIIAAGNQIVGKPYVYGGGHGLALSEIAPAYDCSSSVSHLLWGGGLLGPEDVMTSGALMSWGAPGPGRWVTIYASPDHVFMYVAGLRWDTHNAAGPGDGPPGIGWHPLVREDDGFVARHPVGL